MIAKMAEHLTDWISISVSILAIFISMVSLIITIKFNKYQMVKLNRDQRYILHNHFSEFLSVCSFNNSKEKYIKLKSLLFLIKQDLHNSVAIEKNGVKKNKVYGKFSSVEIYLEKPQSDYVGTGKKSYVHIKERLLDEMTIIQDASRNPETGYEMTDILERINIIYKLFIDLERERDMLLLKLFPCSCRAKKRLRKKISDAMEGLAKYSE